MSLYVPESTISHPRAPWNLEEHAHGTDACYECDDVWPIREMYPREKAKIGSYRLCPACVPKCGWRERGDIPACMEAALPGVGQCLEHGLIVASEILMDLLKDDEPDAAAIVEARKDLADLEARKARRA